MKNRISHREFGIVIGLIGMCICVEAETSLSEEMSRSGPAWDLSHGDLKVSEDNRFLVHEDGTPFFYLSDTNWELFMRARREDAERLMEKRRGQGFTVMFSTLTGLLDSLYYKQHLNVPNVYGDLAFIDRDVTKPNVTPGNDPNDPIEYDFWDHVDFLIKLAKSKGMYMAVIPGWHDQYGEGYINANNARAYGKFLGERIGSHSNVIWVLGGDTHPLETGGLETHRELAAGIKTGDKGRHLMTFHPRGGRSTATWFKDDAWVDFYMVQSGHNARDLPNYNKIQRDYDTEPTRPTLDGENRYEDHAVNWNTLNGWFNHYDNRQAAYWSVFAGSFGHAYGTRGVWQMWEPGRDKYTWLNYYWYDAMDLPGAWDMKHLRDLLLSRPFLGRVPDQSLIVENYEGAHHIQATMGDGYVFVYSPTGRNFQLELGESKLAGKTLIGWWFDPRTGDAQKIGEFSNAGTLEFDPPQITRREVQRGNDWVLVLDDKSMEWTAPGKEALYQ